MFLKWETKTEITKQQYTSTGQNKIILSLGLLFRPRSRLSLRAQIPSFETLVMIIMLFLSQQSDDGRKRKSKDTRATVMYVRPGVRMVGRYEILETLGTGYSGK